MNLPFSAGNPLFMTFDKIRQKTVLYFFLEVITMKKSLLSKLLGAVCSLSMVSASLAVNSACLFFVYEPEMPEAAEALKKIK